MGEQEVARVVALAWGVAAAPQRGPKRELSHERIVEAAIEIADAEGLAAVTMQRVAQVFGFTTMALYRYVSSKEDLQQLMLDAALVVDEWPIDDDDWKVGLQQWTELITGAYVRHPWVLDIPLSNQTLMMPGQLRAVDAGMRAMRTLPASPAEKLLVLMLLSLHARGFAGLARDFASGPPTNEATRQLLRDAVADGGMPDVRAAIESGAYFGDGDPEAGGQDFDYALALLLPGIEASFASRPLQHSAADRPANAAQALADAESELAAVTTLRKATQQRVRQLEQRESRARSARDAARAAAKQAARSGSTD